jgi:hypothetical protein
LRTEALIAASQSMGMFLQTIRQGIIAHGELNLIGVEERRDPWQLALSISHHDEIRERQAFTGGRAREAKAASKMDRYNASFLCAVCMHAHAQTYGSPLADGL